MKKLLPLLVLLTQTTMLSAQITFQKTYGYSGSEFAGSSAKTRDGGFIMTGASENGANNTGDVYVVKTDSAGILQWANTYGTINDEQGAQVSQTADGGYIITGYYDNDHSGKKLLLMKLTATGGLSWTRSYGVNSSTASTYNEEGYYVLQTPDKGYLVSGASLFGMYIIKTDSMGVQQSSRVFNVTYSNVMQQTSDGNYVLMGTFYPNSTSTIVIYLVKITANGSVLWEKFINDPFDNLIVSSFQQTTDKGFIISGSTYINGSSTTTYTPCLIKTDSSAIPQWSKTYSWQNSQGVFVIQTHDGGYALCSNRADGGSGNLFLLKTEPNGSLQSAITYGDSSLSYHTSFVKNIVQTHDKGFALCGYIYELGSGGACYLIKTDSLLNSGCHQWPISPLTNTISLISNTTYTVTKSPAGFDSTLTLSSVSQGTENVFCFWASGINKIQQQSNIAIYPNPASNQLFIDASTSNKLNINIHDVNGKQILSTTVNDKSVLDISTFSNGVYTLTLISSTFSESKKLVIIK